MKNVILYAPIIVSGRRWFGEEIFKKFAGKISSVACGDDIYTDAESLKKDKNTIVVCVNYDWSPEEIKNKVAEMRGANAPAMSYGSTFYEKQFNENKKMKEKAKELGIKYFDITNCDSAQMEKVLSDVFEYIIKNL